jgi:hypothetical protein
MICSIPRIISLTAIKEKLSTKMCVGGMSSVDMPSMKLAAGNPERTEEFCIQTLKKYKVTCKI